MLFPNGNLELGYLLEMESIQMANSRMSIITRALESKTSVLYNVRQ